MTVPNEYILLSEDIRRLENKTQSQKKMNGECLMLEAGLFALHTIQSIKPHCELIIICGSGHNAGDGYALAYLASKASLPVKIFYTQPHQSLPKKAGYYANLVMQQGVICQPIENLFKCHSSDMKQTLIIDALIGIGLNRLIDNMNAQVIQWMNQQNTLTISLDIPSGLHCDSGNIYGDCVKAHYTISFLGLKLGFYTNEGPYCCGKIIHSSLNTIEPGYVRPEWIFKLTKSYMLQIAQNLRRPLNSHKYMFGHVLVVGGSEGMSGACVLAAKAALMVGAGVVSIACADVSQPIIASQLPEVMCYGIDKPESLNGLINKATTIIVGPGLGVSDWAIEIARTCFDSNKSLIVDASALRILSMQPKNHFNWILTPHPGEAQDLIKTIYNTQDKTRLNMLAQIQKAYGGTIVLKGLGTMIQYHSKVSLCPLGNPGMSVAGMGDILSGVIAGLSAQGMKPNQAAELGVWIHAEAGDKLVAQQGQLGLLAHEMLAEIRSELNAYLTN